MRNDFLTTSWMQVSVPWIATAISELRTKKQGFSAVYEMKNDSTDKSEYKRKKLIKFAQTAILSTALGLLAPMIITKNLKKGGDNFIKNYASLFNYKKKQIYVQNNLFHYNSPY